MKTEELKPVPCGCGGEAVVHEQEYGEYEVYCPRCFITTDDYNTEAEAVTAWNRAMGGIVSYPCTNPNGVYTSDCTTTNTTDPSEDFHPIRDCMVGAERTAKVRDLERMVSGTLYEKWNMSDLIDRQKAIDYFATNILVVDADGYAVDDYDDRVKVWTERFSGIPSAEPEPEEFEWCTDCKEYDQDKHCCHRWTKVIRQTVEEMKATERTAKVIKHKYWLGVSLNVVGEQTIGYEWLCENCKKKVIVGDDYCSHCGARLEWDE